jgi:hypothetical protein
LNRFASRSFPITVLIARTISPLNRIGRYLTWGDVMAIDMQRMEQEREAVEQAHGRWLDAAKRMQAHQPGAMAVIGQVNQNYRKALQRWEEYCKKLKEESAKS